MPSSYCRLHVYPATDTPLAAVLRRGPSDWCRLSLWDLRNDGIEHGQWLRGRVYERRCDISADGKLFAYFAHKATGINDLGVDSWAAISRPPWFSALAVWGVGSTYFIGGYFADNRRLMLGGINDAPDKGNLARGFRLTTELPYVDRGFDWTDRTVFINRLLRDGWLPETKAEDPQSNWSRVQPGGEARLIMLPPPGVAHDYRPERHIMEYALEQRSELIPLGKADWADWDPAGRLLLSQQGRLVEWQSGALRLIEDFNTQVPDPQPAPDVALRWVN